jgi:RimJ/RimL family protein N-acetyltransferase
MDLPETESNVETQRLVLEPLMPDHASLLYEPLRDRRLYRYEGLAPPESEAALRRRFEKLATRRSPDGSQLWLNWAVRLKDGPYVGLVQATIEGPHALIGYDIFVAHWRKGYGKESCAAMIDAVRREYGVTSFTAFVDVENEASIALLESLGFKRAWTGPSDDMPGHTDHRYEWAQK